MSLPFLNLHRAWAEPNVLADSGLSEKVGQLLFVGISDTHLSERTIKDLRDIQPGAVILFKRNIVGLKQTTALTAQLRGINKEYASLPLLIATDQEGGRVARIEFTPSMPSPLALGMTKDAKIVESVSFEAGKFLRYLGFNMNLAPVLDVLLQGGSSFIGERSFGSSPKLVGQLGVAFAQGQLRAGIIPTSKHFPGAGLLTKDPHVEKVQVDSFAESSLSPFRQFAQVFPSAVMLSHSTYPSLDASGLPATFSPKIISEMLIHDMEYKGLIITDDLKMGAMKGTVPGDIGNADIGELAVRSFLAGADLLMITWSPKDQRAAKAALLKAVQTGRIPLAELESRVKKIAHVKNLVAPLIRTPAKVDNEDTFESKNLALLDDQILSLNLRRELKSMVVPSYRERFVVVSRTPSFRWGFERALGKPVGVLSSQEFLKLAENSAPEKLLLSEYDCFIFPIYSRRDAIFLNSMGKEIRRKTIAVNFASPGLIESAPLRGVLNLFHPHVNSGKLLGHLIRESDVRTPTSF